MPAVKEKNEWKATAPQGQSYYLTNCSVNIFPEGDAEKRSPSWEIYAT